jgi:hypothetical protein
MKAGLSEGRVEGQALQYNKWNKKREGEPFCVAVLFTFAFSLILLPF